jgi:hypothetical protein
MIIVPNIYGQNDRSWSRGRNFFQTGAGGVQKLTGSATLHKIFMKNF